MCIRDRYEVASNVNNVEFRKVTLTPDFELDAEALLEEVDEWVKVIFLCSPNNPTGNSLNRDEIYKILNNFEGCLLYTSYQEERRPKGC